MKMKCCIWRMYFIVSSSLSKTWEFSFVSTWLGLWWNSYLLRQKSMPPTYVITICRGQQGTTFHPTLTPSQTFAFVGEAPLCSPGDNAVGIGGRGDHAEDTGSGPIPFQTNGIACNMLSSALCSWASLLMIMGHRVMLWRIEGGRILGERGCSS